MPSTVETLKGFVTTGYLCRLFRMSSETVTKWRNERGLPYVRIPGDGRDTIRYRLPKVVDWAKNNEKKTYPVDDESDP